MRTSSLLAAFLGLTILPSAWSDRIIFVDGMELDGDVVKVGEVDITVRVPPGRIRILKKRVDRIVLNVDARLKEVSPTDTGKWLELAKLCEENGDEEGLIKCLAVASENSDVPAERVLQLANLLEKRGMRKELKATLDRYLELNPGRKDIGEKLASLDQEKAEPGADKRPGDAPGKTAPKPGSGKEPAPSAEKKPETPQPVVAVKTPETPLPTVEEKKPEDAGGEARKPDGDAKPAEAVDEAPVEVPGAGDEKTAAKEEPVAAPKEKEPEKAVVKEEPGAEPKEKEKEKTEPASTQPAEGLEADATWAVQDWGNPAEFSVIDQGGDVKNKLAKIAFTNANKDKAAVTLKCAQDLTKMKAIVFDAYNGSDGSVGVAFAIQTLPGWAFFESRSFRVSKQQWATERKIELDAQIFKCRETNWKYESTIKNLQNTAQIIFLIYHDIPQGHVFLDNIRFLPKEEAGKADDAAKPEAKTEAKPAAKPDGAAQ